MFFVIENVRIIRGQMVGSSSIRNKGVIMGGKGTKRSRDGNSTI
jgi:hypothetical protein